MIPSWRHTGQRRCQWLTITSRCCGWVEGWGHINCCQLWIVHHRVPPTCTGRGPIPPTPLCWVWAVAWLLLVNDDIISDLMVIVGEPDIRDPLWLGVEYKRVCTTMCACVCVYVWEFCTIITEHLSARQLILHRISQNVSIRLYTSQFRNAIYINLRMLRRHAVGTARHLCRWCSYAMLHALDDYSELRFVHVQAKEHNKRTRWKDQAISYGNGDRDKGTKKIPKDLVWTLRRHKK